MDCFCWVVCIDSWMGPGCPVSTTLVDLAGCDQRGLFASLWQTTLADVVFGEDRLEMTPFVSFAVLNGVALALSEAWRARGVSWLGTNFAPSAHIGRVLYRSFCLPWVTHLKLVFRLQCPDSCWGLVCGGFLYWFFRFWSRDMRCFSAVVLFCVLFVETVFIRVLEPDGPDWLLLFALLTIGLFTLACWHVIKVQNTKDVDDGLAPDILCNR